MFAGATRPVMTQFYLALRFILRLSVIKYSFIYVILLIALEGLSQGCSSLIFGNSSQTAASMSTLKIVVTFTQATKPAQPILTFTAVLPTAAPTAMTVLPTVTARPAITITLLSSLILITPPVQSQ
jgi:hypothetical protein